LTRPRLRENRERWRGAAAGISKNPAEHRCPADCDLLGCLAMEVALSVIFHNSSDFSIEMRKYAVQLKRPVDPQISFATRTFLMGVPVSINSDGLRDREFSLEKPAGRVASLQLRRFYCCANGLFTPLLRRNALPLRSRS